MTFNPICRALALVCSVLAAGTWLLPAGSLLLLARPVNAAENSPMTVTGEYVLNASDDSLAPTDILRANGEALSALFGAVWDQNNWTYPLAECANGAGRYTGRNHLGQDFTLTIAQWVPTELSNANLSPDQRNYVKEHRYSVSLALSILTTRRASVHMFGVVVTQKLAPTDLTTTSAFLPIYYADPGDPLYSELTLPLSQGAVSLADGFRTNVPSLGVALNDDPCVVAAAARYVAAVETCNAIHNDCAHDCNAVSVVATSVCNIAYNNTVLAAHDSWVLCMQVAALASAAELVVCSMATGGFGVALCVALASVSLAAAYKLCGTAMVTAVTGALATRTACLGLATTARTSCLMGCKSALESCISQAMATCANEVAACTSGGGGG